MIKIEYQTPRRRIPDARMPCPGCPMDLMRCFGISTDGTARLRHFWCRGCGYESRAIGRERLIEPQEDDGGVERALGHIWTRPLVTYAPDG